MSNGCYVVLFSNNSNLAVFKVGEEVALLDAIRKDIGEFGPSAKKAAGELIDKKLEAVTQTTYGSRLPHLVFSGLEGKGQAVVHKGQLGV